MSLRLNRLNEMLEHEINRILRVYFREEAISITVIGALVAPDLRSALVKFSVIGDSGIRRRAVQFFSKNRHFIQQKLRDRLRIRNFPNLRFEMTDAIAEGNHIIEILDAVEEYTEN